MITQFCPYCNQACKKVDGFYVCPIHGKVLREKEEKDEEIKDTSYIG